MNGFRLMANSICFLAVVASLALSPTTAVGARLSGPQGDLTMDDFGYTEYHAGDKRWAVSAKKSSHDFDGNVARIDSLRLQLFSAGAPMNISLRADSGVLRFTERMVELRGAVEANDPRGYRFVTEQLVYDDSTQIVQGQGAVVVEAEGLQVSGRGFDYATKTGTFRIHQSVEALIDAPRK